MNFLKSNFVKGKVLENKKFTDRLFLLRIQADQVSFAPGQFVRLQLLIDGIPVSKPYSLVNAPDEDNVEVLYNTVPNGPMSNALAALVVGDNIQVSQPAKGFFILDEVPRTKHLWMFATGTGLGPYISILKAAEVWARFDKIILVHSVPTKKELVFSELIESLQENHPEQFQFVSCATREHNSAGLNGRMTSLLISGDLEERVGLKISKEHSHIMLCGNNKMISDMKSLLSEREMGKHLRHKPGHITTEQYY